MLDNNNYKHYYLTSQSGKGVFLAVIDCNSLLNNLIKIDDNHKNIAKYCRWREEAIYNVKVKTVSEQIIENTKG